MMPMLRVLLVLLALVASTCARSAQDVYSAGGPWVDDSSRAFELESLRGAYTVATMAYGACQRVCSTTARVLESVHELARQRRVPLRFVVFGLDPAEDKPSDWAAYRAQRRLFDPDLHFLSGSPAAVRQVASRLGVRYWRYGEHTLHDFRIVLVSPEGRVVRTLDHFDDDPVALIPVP